MKKLILLIVLLSAMTSCFRTNILNYKKSNIKIHESNILGGRMNLTLFQTIVNFNKRLRNFSNSLCFDLIDTTIAKSKISLDLETDTLIVKCRYETAPVDTAEKIIGGKIKILKWSENSITIKEKVNVYDKNRNIIKRFYGKRTFTRL